MCARARARSAPYLPAAPASLTSTSPAAWLRPSPMKVKHAVLTSVNSDELKDRGASVYDSAHQAALARHDHRNAHSRRESEPGRAGGNDSAGQEVISHN